MKEPNEDFELFKSEFQKWQKQFGLTGYKVYFKYEPLNEAFADILIHQGDMVATARLNSKLHSEDKPYKDVIQSAKHEALHLLVFRLEHNARCRYSTEAEISESAEELVRRLGGLINA